MLKKWTWVAASFLFVLFSNGARAATLPPNVLQAVVAVDCVKLQGSGTVINGNDGYVLTNAHVVRDIQTGEVSPDCTVGFIDPNTNLIRYEFHSTVEKVIFQPSRSQDFAILKIGDPKSAAAAKLARPFPSITTNEFQTLGEPVTVIGFSDDDPAPVVREGTIEKFENGFAQVSVPLYPGDSGGAALDANGHLIGMSTETVTFSSTDHGQTFSTTTSQLADIRAVMLWLDTFGPNETDRYFLHADWTRYHTAAVFIGQASLGCDYLARTELASTVYCLARGGDRYTFPTVGTFRSWFTDFNAIGIFTLSSVQSYTLTRNVTFKPGTLVKSRTSPQVYLVVDTFGAMRWVPTEARAQALWGSNWANLVRDIPDEFFTNYTIGQPLDQ